MITQRLYMLTLMHTERPKLYTILAFLSAIGLIPVFEYVDAGNISEGICCCCIVVLRPR